MKTIAASDAKNRFGELIEMVQLEPVHIHQNGQDVAILLSPEEFRRLSEAAQARVNPLVEKLQAKSADQWIKVYGALAK